MDADERGCPFEETTEAVIEAAFRVSNALGVGYLERVYENALAHECRKAGLSVQQQVRLVVRYDGIVVGEYTLDLLIDDDVVLELKHAKSLSDAHPAQTLKYLRASGKQLALLINFGTARVQVKRVVNGLSREQTSAIICG
ncbi:MAG: GxxExxY protein [Planctomycetota bacterium]